MQIHGPRSDLHHLQEVLTEFVGGRNIRLSYKPFDATTAAAVLQNNTMCITPILLHPEPVCRRHQGPA